MDAPPPHEDPRPFLAVARHLARARLRARRRSWRPISITGLVLLEDFGDARMRETVDADPARERPIYERAIDLLLDLHAPSRRPTDCAPYDMAEYQREAGLFTEWYAPALGLDGRCARAIARPGPRRWRRWPTAAAVTVLRDYHAENIMLLAGRARSACSTSRTRSPAIPPMISSRCCRMRGATCRPRSRRRCWPATRADRPLDDRAPMRCSARSATPRSSASSPGCGSATASPRYRRFQPRVWRYLERDLAHPALAPVAAWFDANVPAAARAAAWEEYAA